MARKMVSMRYLSTPEVVRTLMKPPSGFALRNAGCALTFGCRSASVRTLLNSGTGPLPGGPCDVGGPGRRGDVVSLPKTAFNWAVAELG